MIWAIKREKIYSTSLEVRIILRSYDDDAAGAPATRSEKVEQQRKTAREHLWLIYLARCTKYYTRSVRIILRAVFTLYSCIYTNWASLSTRWRRRRSGLRKNRLNERSGWSINSSVVRSAYHIYSVAAVSAIAFFYLPFLFGGIFFGLADLSIAITASSHSGQL